MRNPVSRFAYTRSDLDMRRSSFDRNSRHLTTMSAGKLYPLLVDEVLPGDTFSIDMSSLVRMSTPIHPVMDNCYLDTYFFFVPNRIVWDHWKEFMGESPDDPYINPIEYSVPALVPPEIQGDYLYNPASGVAPRSLLDYLGIPIYTRPTRINALPVRAFCKIWNEWFRDQNLQHSIDVITSDQDLEYMVGIDIPETDNEFYLSDTSRGGQLPPVNKYHDYFTSALKEPQKGEPVPIPLSGMAPVYANSLINTNDIPKGSGVGKQEGTEVIIPGYTVDGDGNDVSEPLAVNYDSGSLGVWSEYKVDGTNYEGEVRFSNLGADLSNLVGVYATISDLRYAFQLQKFLEADNRGGTRYREILKQHFGVTSPDATQQVPEFLGGKRIPINIAQVLQTSSTDATSPQGNTAAYSLTTDRFSAFTKSFTEHGFVFCVGCIRTEHTYQNGMEKMFSRFNKFDYYFPEFANISDQPIYNREIYIPAVSNQTWLDEINDIDKIFGYQEPWAEYKYKPNRVSGLFRSAYLDGSLDVWHYADDYVSNVYLSEDWIRETRQNVDRTLALTGDEYDQFICDFYFKMRTTRAMPMFSIPGLSDHH